MDHMIDDTADASATERADLLIVGSGIMGAGVAQQVRSAHPHARIVMVDGAPLIGSVPGQHLHDSPEPEIWERYNERVSSGIQSLYLGVGPTPEIGPSLGDVEPGMYHLSSLGELASEMPAAAVAWNVGGMGVHWTAATPWPWGDEVFDFGNRTAWEQDLLTSRRLLHVHPDPFPGSKMQQTVTRALDALFGEVSAPGRHVQPMPMAVEPTEHGIMPRTGPNRIFPPIASGDDRCFTLLANTLAVALEHREGHVSGARVRDMTSGAERFIRAAITVVCADTIRTPQLLFASGIRPAALGRYLNEHAFLTGRVIVDLERFGIAANTLPNPREGEWVVDSQWLPHSGPAQPFHGQIMDMVYMDEDKNPLGYGVGLSWYIPTELRSANRLVFSDHETDAMGMPRIKIEFDYSHRDLQMIERARESQRRAGESLGAFDSATESALLPAGSSLHFTGSVRMGSSDDGTSVCDQDARVWGFDNLFLAGNGVIPTAVVCNTTLTGMITAVRAARAIIHELGKRVANGSRRD
jgi:choline dehydrogenase-like flavoprotein